MRIVSKFKDFYDGGMRFGHDPSTIYVRETKLIGRCDDRENNLAKTVHGVVGFCGNLYQVIGVRSCNAASFAMHDRDWYYTYEAYERDGEPQYGARHAEDAPGSAMRRRDVKHRFESNASSYFGANAAAFHEHAAPVLLWDRFGLIVNPPLRPLQFFKVKNAYEAFQELESFVGGVLLRPTKPVPVPDDETMQEIKGFDHEYSFRKEPKS